MPRGPDVRPVRLDPREAERSYPLVSVSPDLRVRAYGFGNRDPPPQGRGVRTNAVTGE